MFLREPLVNEGTAAHSERAIRLFSMAIRCSTFDVRCIDETTGTCTFNEREMSLEAIACVVPKLRHRNANGSAVFIRPCLPFALADDVRARTLERMLDDDLCIAAAIITSPGSFQVWVPLAGPLQTVEPELCVAACERLEELYGTDPGVIHRDSFGRAPGFRNRKLIHDLDGRSPLVEMSNRHCGFRGYDRTLLADARRIVGEQPKPPGKRSAGAVLTNNANLASHIDDGSSYEVSQDGKHIVTFSPVSVDLLFQQFLEEMTGSGYILPQRQNGTGEDRSQRDLDVLRWMSSAGVPCHVAQAALEAGSDKAQERGEPYVWHLISTIWTDL